MDAEYKEYLHFCRLVHGKSINCSINKYFWLKMPTTFAMTSWIIALFWVLKRYIMVDTKKKNQTDCQVGGSELPNLKIMGLLCFYLWTIRIYGPPFVTCLLILNYFPSHVESNSLHHCTYCYNQTGLFNIQSFVLFDRFISFISPYFKSKRDGNEPLPSDLFVLPPFFSP